MYAAKEEGRGRARVFHPDLKRRAMRRNDLERELFRAVANAEFHLEYQPIALDSGAVTGVEALLRWDHPTRGIVLPGAFIGLAEETGMILPIGDWVLREACAQASRWREARPERSMQMSVNLSVHQFHEHNLIGHVARVLADTGFDARDLALEITESVLMEDSASTIARLRDLRNMGVQVAIDDFGTGYSSLSYLKRFPVDLLNLDRSFIQALGQGPASLRSRGRSSSSHAPCAFALWPRAWRPPSRRTSSDASAATFAGLLLSPAHGRGSTGGHDRQGDRDFSGAPASALIIVGQSLRRGRLARVPRPVPRP